MIPAAFEYEKATSVQQASELLGRFGEDAKELNYIHVDGGKLRIGALTRHVQIQNSDAVKQNLPILAEVADEVGDNQVRNMGTIGGVIAHADAAGDYPTLALILEAEVVTNKRRYAAKDFFKDIFTTPLEQDELVCEVV